MAGTVQFSTDVTIDAITSVMQKHADEYNRTGNKKVLDITVKEIVTEAMNTKVPKEMLVPNTWGFTPGKYGAGNFTNGKTIGETIRVKNDPNLDFDIKYSERNIKNIAESFVKGPEAMQKYYDESSRYWGQGYNENLKLIRIDSLSGVRKDQFEILLERRKQYDEKRPND